ncbi:acyltransferase family protein [Pseudonocardia bannensis]|uniref:Acyltransferase n=1 Tax=Pseudonocardia bannensis TaxID=630973 RepID=A0A848DC12_9PSEU|nr:acyltransferase [Pseudonocardia bannensis]NMH90141.1 acyltransferase [Pseudonocardia bannensis]
MTAATGPSGPAKGAVPLAASRAVPLSDAFSGRSNSFGILRWTLATLVIVGHAYPLGGFSGGTDPLFDWSGGQESCGGLAVAGFFIISGFLITRSWASSGSVMRFMWHRFLRIFPAFWVCLVLTAFAFAPLAWWRERGTLAGFLTEPARNAVGYITQNFWLSINQYEIGDLLSSTPYGSGRPGAWNGSLWTLSYEFGCYLVIALLGAVGLLNGHRAIVTALASLMYLVTLSAQIDPGLAARLVPLFSDTWFGRFLFLFLLGSMFALYADRIQVDDRLGALALVATAVSLHGGGWIAVGYPALAYMLIWLAVRLPFSAFDRPGDFSYGTYIYAFPIQMLLAEFGVQRLGLAAYMLLGIAITAAFAVLSWHVVEKRALRLKRWTPQRPRWRSRAAEPDSLSSRARPTPESPATAPETVRDSPQSN